MKAREIARPVDKAEGLCCGVPYDTQLVSSDGVAVHFWLTFVSSAALTHLERCIRVVRNHRDVVAVTYSAGEPTGFWARSDIGEP